MPRGVFITFEGLDGSGKTTQLRRLAEWLEAEQESIVVTRQPGGTRIGDRIRTLLLDSRTENLDSFAELGLMFSDRAQAIAEIIRPALDEGKIVLCDRFTDSTEAYQGGGRELGSEIVLSLHKSICGGLQPDVTFLLMPDFDASLKRARKRNTKALKQEGKDENRFERENDLFYRRVFEKYREIAAREPLRVIAIDGDATIEEIHERIVSVMKDHLARVR
ncbi:dTMP kinase [Silvibacterium acidisoli]|uniref:dTMP kinase n=1 Tax=Acidobacteriaceae bacterium ZG23-2 TaxID=2883246 RepID=UPI00406D2B85